jgi:capsular polysaccharide biosynthesis protein
MLKFFSHRKLRDQSLTEAMRQPFSISQSVSQSISHPATPLVTWPVSQSAIQSVTQPHSQSSQSVSQSVTFGQQMKAHGHVYRAVTCLNKLPLTQYLSWDDVGVRDTILG